ncbi:MAG: SAM-dependent methyltransferase [Acetobacteraceae bacterium]|nr:SAM-dependent methyltransferase [Acetobacteraceae bacterium]
MLDYGHLGGAQDTLQAVRRHRPLDPLAAVGEADLSAQVDFAALARYGAGAGGSGVRPCPPGRRSCARWVCRSARPCCADRRPRSSPDSFRPQRAD